MNRLRTVLVMASRVLLGAFVLVQIVYLIGSLLFNMEQAFRSRVEIGWLRAWNERDVNGFHQYGQATAQRQRWALFAPEAWKEFQFLEMELRWDEPKLEPVLLRAYCEPEDLNAFGRLGGFRIRKFEESIMPETVQWEVLFGEGEEENEVPAVAVNGENTNKLMAYIRWRLATYRREHPDRPPPSEVLIWIHGYRIPEPPGPHPWRWHDTGSQPAGRWLP
jgi:hypothetical protein